jgi:hypothetical protein
MNFSLKISHALMLHFSIKKKINHVFFVLVVYLITNFSCHRKLALGGKKKEL